MLSFFLFPSQIYLPPKNGRRLYWLTYREMTLFLCQITSQQTKDAYAINLMDSDMVNGSLKKVSNIRPNRIFTAYEHIVLYKIGSIHANKLQQVRDKIIELLDQ